MVVSARTQMGGYNACLPCIKANDFYEKNNKIFLKKNRLNHQNQPIEKANLTLEINKKMNEKNILNKNKNLNKNLNNDSFNSQLFNYSNDTKNNLKFMRPSYPPPSPILNEKQNILAIEQLSPKLNNNNNINNLTNKIILTSGTTSSSSKTSSEYELNIKSRGIMGQFFR